MPRLRPHHGFLAILLSLLLAGCGETVSFIAIRLNAPLASTFTAYHAYGDSITYGYKLPDPATEAYPTLIAKATGLPLSNYAIVGDQACDIPNRQIFPHADNPSTASQGLYSLLISTNDVDVKGAGDYMATFTGCLDASIAWLAVPAEQKILATSSNVTGTGTIQFELNNDWHSIYTNAPASIITFPLHLASAGPVYVWYRLIDGNPGVFSYAIDGSTLGTATTNPNPNMSTQNGTVSSLGLLRLPNISAGNHTFTVTQTSSSGQAAIVAVGAPSATRVSGTPRVMVGTTPRQLAGAGGACSDTDAPCQAYIATITAQVALFAGDGLDVRLFDSRKYMSTTQADMIDALHPNARGDFEIAQALADAID